LAAQFADHCAEVLAPLDETDALAAVIAREPAPTATIPLDELDRLCGALAVVADLKSTYSVGHSMRVAELAAAAATVAGLSGQRCTLLRCAGLVHNVGAVVVPSALLDIAHRVGAAELERIRLHTYWTERILERCPALTMLAALSGPAAAQHQEYAASGYQSWAEEPHRSASFDARSASFDARVLEAAEVFASLTEPRPGRPPLSASKSASELNRKSARRTLDPEACAAVIEGAGLPRPRARRPCGLTDRELDILRLAARGLSNQQIADEVVISARTVGHHLSHIYDKTGLRTRAGVAVFAAEHGLLPEMHR